MATAIAPVNIAPETRDRVYSPLHKLRGIIRRYILVESLAWVFILFGIWFWLGLAVDYGTFKILGFDWAQLLARWFRGIVLLWASAISGLWVLVQLIRLVREFRPEALALVLERRFPKLLGDKLITAVELSDLKQAKEFGYSPQMIAATVRDVSQRVDQIPMGQVFNWGRLFRRWFVAIVLTAGIFFLVTVIYLARYRSLDVFDYGHRFYDVSSVWFERNVLLRDTLWPRRAHLEILDFPRSGELRIGRDAPSPRIRVLAIRWVQADRSVESSWRPLVWSDLKPEYLGGQAPPALPHQALLKIGQKQNLTLYYKETPDDGSGQRSMFVAWDSAGSMLEPAAFADHWSIDQMERVLADASLRKQLSDQISADELAGLDRVLEELNKRAGEARFSKRLRRLEVPRSVAIHYWGQKTSNEMPMTRQQEGSEFACVLSDLRESVKFYVEGEDYSTYPYRRITLVPPPMLTRLEKDEYVPAYHYHRLPADGTSADLKGKKQVRLGQGVSLTGTTSRIDIPFGSDLVLRGEVDKDLAQARIRFRTTATALEAPGAEPLEIKTENLEVGADRRSISRRFDNVTLPIEFSFEFLDTDNVRSMRHVIIVPADDKTPDVNVAVEVIRKTNQGYMCTYQAMIPFSGTIRDDVGLAKVEYAISYSRVESLQVVGMRAAVAAGVMGLASPSGSPRELFTGALLVDYLARLSESRDAVTNVEPLALRSFEEIARDKDREHRYGKGQLPDLLTQQLPNIDDLKKQRSVTQFDVKPNLESLDLMERVPAFQKGLEETIRPRYRVRLTIAATDNNVETGPRTGQNKETFTFVVVAYEELLAEMHKDEETLSYKAQELLDKMIEVRDGLNKVIERMPRVDGADEFRASASRMFELIAEVEKGSDVARELLSEYNRLLKEAETNRLPTKFLEDKQRVVSRLEEVIRSQFERARESHTAFKDVLESRRVPEPAVVELARQRQDELIRQLELITDAIGWVVGTTKLAEDLRRVLQKNIDLDAMVKIVLQEAEDDVLFALATVGIKAGKVEMQAGEKRIVNVGITRDEHTKGKRLLLAINLPKESGMMAPAAVNIPADSDSAQFELIAGPQAGLHEIRLGVTSASGRTTIPQEGGKPAVLQVSVK